MPRSLLIRTDEYPYHVVNRSNNKEFFYLDLDELWLIFIDILGVLHYEYKCNIHSFVLMSNHYHLILSTPQKNLSEAMNYMHREVAKRANKKAKRINHFFGGRYKPCLIQNENYYWNAVKYVFRNPVDAGLCNRVEKYKYSSLNFSDSQLWQMVDFFTFPQNTINLDLNWLNEAHPHMQRLAIKKGLRRFKFELPRGKNGHTLHLDAMACKKVLGT